LITLFTVTSVVVFLRTKILPKKVGKYSLQNLIILTTNFRTVKSSLGWYDNRSKKTIQF